jgi:hypothetical protein
MEVKLNEVIACAGEVERMPMPNAVEAPSTTEAKFQVVMSKETPFLPYPSPGFLSTPIGCFCVFLDLVSKRRLLLGLR